MAKRLTEIEIATRIVPTMLRWPAEAKAIAWDKLRGCVEALRGRCTPSICIPRKLNGIRTTRQTVLRGAARASASRH